MSPYEIAVVARRLDEITERLERIETHTRETNSRVSKLELWRARLDGAKAALAWLPSLAVGVTVGVTVATVTTLIA